MVNPDPSVAISVEGLRKSFGDREVVRGVSFSVARGECVGLLGHNGAGKTTTIEILEGYLARDGGQVSVLGTDPVQADAAWRRRIGIVLQDMEVFPTLTVAESLRMFADLYPAPRAVGDALELVDLGRLASTRVGRLSGGEKRRLDVALGLIGNPELLFLDEPTTGLDPSARRDLWELVGNLTGSGVTIVLTTHYMDEAQTLADRLVILADGVVAAEGTFDELVERLGDTTTISFREPDAVRVAAIGQHLGVALRVDGDRAEFSSAKPQTDLQRLLRWAEEHGVGLEHLVVQRSSLEDLFLSIGPDGQDATVGATTGARR
ncbi:MAG: ABC transporter ATP-binding protein [Actinomycetota bacterium]|nr:ABC transporter ATP-binding protein [Actinomycetota bacterium]MDA3015582.1 ABC transporter ATP-binding protein [Actinomycetota bacterium]MDA3028449.1 ABC transporter ATP-binding protein [Actinomycetota bacterium]